MTRDETINVIHKTIYQFFDGGDGEPMSDKDELLLAVNKAICNNIKALEQEPRWIPVSERLPETHVFYNTHGKHISSDYVLVTVRLSQNGFHEQMVTVGRYSNNDWKLLYGNICGSIKAWMPLPEPYKDRNVDCCAQEVTPSMVLAHIARTKNDNP